MLLTVGPIHIGSYFEVIDQSLNLVSDSAKKHRDNGRVFSQTKAETTNSYRLTIVEIKNPSSQAIK